MDSVLHLIAVCGVWIWDWNGERGIGSGSHAVTLQCWISFLWQLYDITRRSEFLLIEKLQQNCK